MSVATVNLPESLREQMEEDALWKEPQVSATLGVSRVTLWQLERNGTLPAVRIGRSVRWRKSDVMTYIRNLGR